MKTLGELWAESVDGDFIRGQSLLWSAVVELLADLPAVGQRIGVGVELASQTGVFQRREVTGVGRRRLVARQKERPGHQRQHDDDGRRSARAEPRRSDARPARRWKVDVPRQHLAAVGVGRFGTPVANTAGGTAGGWVGAFVAAR